MKTAIRILEDALLSEQNALKKAKSDLFKRAIQSIIDELEPAIELLKKEQELTANKLTK